MALENACFQQHGRGYFAFKHLLGCSDNRTLPLVTKICNTRAKQLSMAATARVIWLYACVRYWPYQGVGRCTSLLSVGINSMSFQATNRLQVDKVQTAGCFSVQPLLRIFVGVTGVTQKQPKKLLNQSIHTKKCRNTSKVSLLYIFYKRKGTI